MEYITVIVPLAFLAGAVLFYYKGDKLSQNVAPGSLPTLEKYSRDLTRLAREKKLDPVIGRSKEISRVIQILSRRTKNNPVLIGQAGVGKTAIAVGLALAIAEKKVPPVLNDKRVLSLDLSSILAGTKYRGEFEQRLKRVTDEIIAAKRMIILFIDEIHILAEAGGAEGAINAVDILKPLLSGGELQVVGATTPEEYEKYIINDKTLARRLQPVMVAEPSAEQTKQILEGVRLVYEKYHNVTITPSAINEAIVATKKIKNRAYPDKAIDVLDEASSKARIDALAGPGATIPKVTAKEIRVIVAQWQEVK